MPITQVGATTTTGDSASASSRAPAVPTGAAAGDVAFVFLDLWEASDPAVTAPAGFTQLFKLPGGSGGKSYCFWKRLTAADAGTYTFSWSGNQWATAHCTMLRGVKASGDPVGANYATALAISSTFPSVTVSPPYIPALLWHGYNDSAGTHTAPTGFTKTAEVDCAVDAIQLPTSGSSWTASGATVSASSAIKAMLLAVEPDAGGPTTHDLAGTITVTSGSTGAIAARRALAGTVAATSTTTGTIGLRARLAGTIAAASNAAGTVAARLGLSGTIGATSATSGALGLRARLAGAVHAISHVYGRLAGGPYAPAPPQRTLVVPAESRVYAVPHEDRTYRIGAR